MRWRTRTESLLLLLLCFATSSSMATTLYWDSDSSTSGNNSATGANLGGSGNWTLVDANWWDTSQSTLQLWSDSNDAVFWGNYGNVNVSTVSVSSVTFKSPFYFINS